MKQHERTEELTKQLAVVKQNVHEERDGIIRARHRLKELQAKLITSTGENLLDRDEMLRQQQQKLDAELMEEKRREQELAREVEKHEEARLGLEEQYATLQVTSLESDSEANSSKTQRCAADALVAGPQIVSWPVTHARYPYSRRRRWRASRRS